MYCHYTFNNYICNTKLYNTLKLNKMKTVRYLKDNRDFDSKGNVVNLEREYVPAVAELSDPYDPAYLADEPDVDTFVTSNEEAYYKRVARLQKALLKLKVKYVWHSDESFEISYQEEGKEFPQVRFLYVDETYFTMATHEEEIWWSENLREFMQEVKQFLNI